MARIRVQRPRPRPRRARRWREPPGSEVTRFAGRGGGGGGDRQAEDALADVLERIGALLDD